MSAEPERTDTALRAIPPLTAHTVGRSRGKEVLRWPILRPVINGGFGM